MKFLNDIFLTLLLALVAGLTAAVVMRGLYVAFKRSAASFSKNIGSRLLLKSALVFLFSAIAFTGAYMTQAEKRKSGNGEQENWGNGRLARLNGEQETGNGESCIIQGDVASCRVADTTAITISSFSASTNSVEIETFIDPDSILPGSRILAYAKFGDLIASAWTNVASSIVLPGETNLCFNIPLPEPPPSSSFFVLARENDSDGEGLDDSFERYVALTDPFSADTDGDGWDDFSEVAAGTSPTNSSLSLLVNANGCRVLKISDALSFSTNAISDLASPQGSGFYSLQVATPRPTAWKQVFVSGSPDGSAGWNLSGAQISYEDSDGMCGTMPSVSADSCRLQLSTNENLSVTISITATAAQVSLDSPLYLHFYEPDIHVLDSHDYTDDDTGIGYHVVVGEWQDGYAPSARLSVDMKIVELWNYGIMEMREWELILAAKNAKFAA